MKMEKKWKCKKIDEKIIKINVNEKKMKCKKWKKKCWNVKKWKWCKCNINGKKGEIIKIGREKIKAKDKKEKRVIWGKYSVRGKTSNRWGKYNNASKIVMNKRRKK